jgi:hypothetical protein
MPTLNIDILNRDCETLILGQVAQGNIYTQNSGGSQGFSLPVNLQAGVTYEITFNVPTIWDPFAEMTIIGYFGAISSSGGQDVPPVGQRDEIFGYGNINPSTTSTFQFTPNVNIDYIWFSAPTSSPSIYDDIVTVTTLNGLVITVDDGNSVQVFNDTNPVNVVVVDDSTCDISVVFPGTFDYNNTVRVYDNDVDMGIAMIPIITDPENPDFRRPFPCFFFILEPCSYNIHVYNAQSAPFGMISYYHTLDEANTFATTPNGVLDTCVPDILTITQRIVVREVANCGGTSPVIWDETYTINGIETTEYKPYVVLERALNCCEPLEEEIIINPQEIELYNTGIHACDITTIDPVLRYLITTPEGTETELASYSGTQVDAGPLTSLGFSYTPALKGTHTLTVEVTNCCETVRQTYTFDVCNSWVITNTDCNIVKIVNLSSENTLNFTIKELTDFEDFRVVEIDNESLLNIPVLPGREEVIDLQVDNLYTITVDDGNAETETVEQIYLLDCNIKKCKKELLRNFLCGEDECDVQTREANKHKLTEFVTLEKIIYQKWDEWIRQQSIVNTMSINDILEDVITLSKAIETISKLCAKCGVVDSCSADKRSTCNYTITNWNSYLVPVRCANIVVPKDGNNCGC